MDWLTLHPSIDRNRIDLREMMIQVSPLHEVGAQLVACEWHVILAIGAGIAKLRGVRHTDSTTVIEGVLRDHPSLRVKLTMAHAAAASEMCSIECLCVTPDVTESV